MRTEIADLNALHVIKVGLTISPSMDIAWKIFQFGFFIACLVCLISVSYAEDGELKTSPLAVAFGSQPDFLSLSLSPNGDKVAFIQYHPDGYDFVRTLDLTAIKFSGMIMSSSNIDTEISWCAWGNHERLFCFLSTRYSYGNTYSHAPQIEWVNYDGKDMKQINGYVIDLMPDDPNHVLIQLWAADFRQANYERKTRTGVVDIYTSKVTNLSGLQSTTTWISTDTVYHVCIIL